MKNFSTYLGEDIVEKVLNEASAEEFKTVNKKYVQEVLNSVFKDERKIR